MINKAIVLIEKYKGLKHLPIDDRRIAYMKIYKRNSAKTTNERKALTNKIRNLIVIITQTRDKKRRSLSLEERENEIIRILKGTI